MPPESLGYCWQCQAPPLSISELSVHASSRNTGSADVSVLRPPTELVNQTAGSRRQRWPLNQMKVDFKASRTGDGISALPNPTGGGRELHFINAPASSIRDEEGKLASAFLCLLSVAGQVINTDVLLIRRFLEPYTKFVPRMEDNADASSSASELALGEEYQISSLIICCN
ncbi:hypothetical protein EYF80_027800 [Liparis tanakae]|uniref:Uncharacterized protein n=1 Tax=Liparis tanakae TaxID=230148 RepID=A0A4Z2H9M8_9TELE|nr:hypothetical protein EYF80_027800 [Liparis tanakae]